MNFLTQPPSQTPLLLYILAPITQLVYKEITIIAKVYIDGQKYNRTISFNYKLTIFYNICKRSSLPYKGYITAFPIILKGLVEDHYYSSNLADKLFKDIYIYIWNFFTGLEYYRKNFIEWNSISL